MLEIINIQQIFRFCKQFGTIIKNSSNVIFKNTFLIILDQNAKYLGQKMPQEMRLTPSWVPNRVQKNTDSIQDGYCWGFRSRLLKDVP